MADTVKIDLNGEFTTEDLESILRSLIEARAGMTPPVPKDRPTGEEEVLLQDDSEFIVARLVDGGLRFWFRHIGLGWFALTVTPERADGLVRFLGEQRLGATYTLH